MEADIGHGRAIATRPVKAADVLIEVPLEIDDAVFSEPWNQRSGLGI
jgi:hypothetical protein